MPGLTRRRLLALLGALVAGACARPAERPMPTPPASLPPEFDAWNREAQGMLSDALDALRTFDVFMAYRVTTPASKSRTPSDLDWDPPTSAEWNDATHVAQGLSGRADRLFETVSSAHLDVAIWRQQRDLADACHSLVDLGAALAACRERVDTLPPGDAGQLLGWLDRAWAQWTQSAARWDLSRSEPIACGS